MVAQLAILGTEVRLGRTTSSPVPSSTPGITRDNLEQQGAERGIPKSDFPIFLADSFRPYIRPDCHKPFFRKLACRNAGRGVLILKAFCRKSESTDETPNYTDLARRTTCFNCYKQRVTIKCHLESVFSPWQAPRYSYLPVSTLDLRGNDNEIWHDRKRD